MVQMVMLSQTTATNGLIPMEMAMGTMQMALKVINSKMRQLNGMIQIKMGMEKIQLVSLQMHAQIQMAFRKKIALAVLIQTLTATPTHLLGGQWNKVRMPCRSSLPNGEMETGMGMETI